MKRFDAFTVYQEGIYSLLKRSDFPGDWEVFRLPDGSYLVGTWQDFDSETAGDDSTWCGDVASFVTELENDE
jgi:hypothetical protein